jgi:hypothetical protein
MDFMLRAKNMGQVNIARILARSFVVVGGLFWTLSFFGSNTKASYATLVYTLPEVGRASVIALLPLALTVGVFVLGLYYERIAGILLAAMVVVMLVYGAVLHLDEPVLWTTAITVLVAPAAISAALYLLAARTQEVQELGQHGAAAPSH